MDVNSLSISDPTLTAIEGLKICKIQTGKDDAVWSSKDEVETPFTPSSFNEGKANKHNLDIRCVGEHLHFFSELDRWAVEYIAVNYLRLFGKQLSPDKVSEMYRPYVRKTGSFDPLLRTKITLEGLHRTRYWAMDKTDRMAPESWPTSVFKAQIRVGYLYISGSTFGLALDCTDIQVCKEISTPVCSF